MTEQCYFSYGLVLVTVVICQLQFQSQLLFFSFYFDYYIFKLQLVFLNKICISVERKTQSLHLYYSCVTLLRKIQLKLNAKRYA